MTIRPSMKIVGRGLVNGSYTAIGSMDIFELVLSVSYFLFTRRFYIGPLQEHLLWSQHPQDK